MKAVLGTLLALCVYLVLAWFVGSWLHLTGSSLWILRGGLALIGIIGAGAFLFFYLRSHKSAGPSASDSDIDVLVANAVKRLQNSPLPQKHSLDSLTTVFLLGDPNSTKTSLLMNSGLEPELLAGQVYQDSNIAPTRITNLLFNRQALFVDVGGEIMNQPPRWQQLVKRLQRNKFTSAFGGKEQPLRAAVVCLNCEEFLQQGANERVLAAARKYASRLQELSQNIGISFPVYVIFTKTDRIPFFQEFFKNLSREEALQAVGVTLPMNLQNAGVYAEEENRRISARFDELFFAVAEKRIDLLARESDPAALAPAYEFPREFRKLRTFIVQFLVELGRPSQLSVNPFVRGFYFAGVRPIVVEDMPGLSVAASAPSAQSEAGATQVFHVGMMQPPQPAAARAPSSRRVPQWMFSTRLFHDVILKDRAAMATSAFSVQTSIFRRIIFAVCILLLFIWGLGMTVSFLLNQELHSEVLAAANAIRTESVSADSNPTIDQLQKLDRLRQDVLRLQQYKREGAPLSMRWGLYTGDDLLDPARRVYFNRFNSLLFAATQNQILGALQRLPNTPGAQDNYDTPYKLLKAYLITTKNHDKSSVDFLSPVLYEAWAHGRIVDDTAAQLIRNQFDFYSNELIAANPFSSQGDDLAVGHAREYLKGFKDIERIYASMIEEASKVAPTITFDRDIVRASKSVRGAYSAKGWQTMQDFITKHHFLSGEEWVLGPVTTATGDQSQLEQELRTRYHDDFINKWREFLRSSSVARYRDVRDATIKLGTLSSNRSPLLELLKVVSTNTAPAGDAGEVFQPAQSVVPPGGEIVTAPSNQQYLQGLVGLQVSLQQLAGTPNDPGAIGAARTSSGQATGTTMNMANGFRPDAGGDADQVVRNLLLAPIRNADAVIGNIGVGPLNAAGAALCSSFHSFANLYPFNPAATQEANIQQVNAFFGAGGALANFYDQNLKTQVQQVGSDFAQAPNATVHLNPRFLAFFANAKRFSDAVYAGSQQPQMHFTLKPGPIQGVDTASLDFVGQKVSSPGSAISFTWRGGELDSITMTGNSNLQMVSYHGPWAMFHFSYDAERVEQHGNIFTLVWIPKTSGQPMQIGGRSVSVNYDVDMQGGAPILKKGYLQGLQCVTPVAMGAGGK